MEAFLEISHMKSVSIVIPNFNGRQLLERYLPFVEQACQHATLLTAWEIIVVDDASTDDSITFLETQYPNIRIIRNRENRGFSITANKGIDAATMQLILMLNNDIQLPDNFFDALIPYFDREDTFGVYSTLKDTTGTIVLEGRKLPLVHHDKLSYTDDKSATAEGLSFYLCGGNALIDRQKLVALHGYDEIYSPFYCEDMDLSLRAWQHGWKSWYTDSTACIHQHSATINSQYTSHIVKRTFVRNRLIVSYFFLPQKNFRRFLLKLHWHAFIESLRLQPDAYCDAKRLIKQSRRQRTPIELTHWFR
ncbi:MAG: glycosyltransferase family 2 protein [Paludibacteraceae bacterium]